MSCCVPDLQFDDFFPNFNGFGSKLDSDGDIMVGIHLLLNELKDGARFSDTFDVKKGLPESPMTMNLKR